PVTPACEERALLERQAGALGVHPRVGEARPAVVGSDEGDRPPLDLRAADPAATALGAVSDVLGVQDLEVDRRATGVDHVRDDQVADRRARGKGGHSSSSWASGMTATATGTSSTS